MKTLSLISVLLVLVMLLAACTTSPEGVPATGPTQGPNPTLGPDPALGPYPEPGAGTAATALPTPSATTQQTAAPASSDPDVVDLALADERLTTLVTALQATGLDETLKGAGPFTVFAPTDEAFAALPPGMLESLLQSRNPQHLTNVLLYHVVEGRLTEADLAGMDSLETLYGESLTITMEDGILMIGDATLVISDIEASNGIIHVVDTVLLSE